MIAELSWAGVVVTQAGWWSLYSDLGLWCGLLGGAAMLVGALGFDRGVAGHSEQWRVPTERSRDGKTFWLL